MSLSEVYRSARSLEAIENYALASSPSVQEVETRLPQRDNLQHVYHDKEFWQLVFEVPDAWGQTFNINYVVMSEWVPRVPGLYWSRGATDLRSLGDNAVQYESKDWRVLKPLGKSQKVFGGVGTLKFPPDESGRRLVSLCAGQNASAGIPALISPEVWEHCQLGEGRFVPLTKAKWQRMSDVGWAERFPSIKGIPKGYLVVDHPGQMSRQSTETAAIQFHPCTVMEYYRGDAKLFDLVYATADTREPDYRSQLERFFESYKNDVGRYGRYLLSADISDPWWEAEFDSPAALQRAEPGAKSQLALLQARVRKESFKGQNLDDIVQLIAGKYDNDGLTRISTVIGVPPAHWFVGRAVADSTIDLLTLCVSRGKVEELLDAVEKEYPASFM